MKPLWLEISAFGSYGQKSYIPFEKLGEGGLFLITGDTGAGKTTIFDAICFVLYGEASGSVRTADLMRSDFAKPKDKTYVKMGFSHRGKYFEITRSPKYQRPKKSGTGETTETADALLVKPDGTQSMGYRTVTEEIENLLSIDAKQFKQIVMIAQGEFLKLLLADSAERGQILRKVFHTSSFLNMQLKLKEEEKKLRGEWEELGKSILQYLEGIIVDENATEIAFLSENRSNIYKTEDTLAALEIIINQDNHYLEEIKQILLDLEKENNCLSKKIVVGEQENSLFMQKEAVLKQLLELQNKEIEVENIYNKTLIWQKARVNVYPVEKLLSREKEQLNNIIQDLEKLIVDMKAGEENFTIAEKAYHQEKQNQSEIDELTNKINKATEAMPLYEQLAVAQANLKSTTAELADVEKALAIWVEKKKKIADEVQLLEKTVESFADVQTQLVTLQNQYNNQLEMQKKAKILSNDFIEIAEGKKKYLKMQKRYKALEEDYIQKKELSSSGELMFLQAQAGVLAESLQEKMPCPVCGSLEHPKKAVLPEHFKTQSEVNDLKQATNQAQLDLQKQSEDCSSENARLTAKFYEIKKQAEELFPAIADIDSKEFESSFEKENKNLQLSIQDLSDKIKQLQSNNSKREKAASRIAQLTEQIEKENKTAEAQREKQTKFLEDVGNLRGTVQVLQAQLPFQTKQEQQEQLEKYNLRKKELTEKLQNAELAFQQTKESLANTKVLLKQCNTNQEQQQKNVENAEKDFEKILKEQNFDSVDEYLLHLKTLEEIEKTKNDVDAFRSKLRESKIEFERLEVATAGKIPVDIAALKQEAENVIRLQSEHRKKQEDITVRYKNNQNIFKRAGESWKKRIHLEKTYSMVRDLSKTANGELSGKEKLAFEQYAQSFYFERILLAANERMAKLTNQRYIFLHKEGAENKRSQSGLELEVLDYYTGKARSVKSLSGGEAFKASLSLALGLSDVIQQTAGGVQIDAMFIDEGFGSLDEESLEQAMRALWDLAYGSRFVGIISHVSQLKEQIEKKIWIQKSQNGSSVTIEL